MSRFKPDLALLFLCLILAGIFVLLATPSALATEHLQMDSFNATSIAVVNGTLNDGNLASTYLLDGDWYNVSETNGVPGLDIRVNFTGLGTDQTGGCFEFYHLYSGHSNHEIQVQLWNFTDSSWELVGTVLFNETAGWKCVGLSPLYPHYFSGGKLWARFYHATVGHLAHELQIDEIELHVSYPFECPPPAITDSCAVVDDYTDESGVAGKHMVVRNATFDAMELNFTSGLGPNTPMDIWTTGGFTEVDPGGDNLKNTNGTRIYFDDVDQDEGDRIYKDFGVNYFDGGWEYYFRVYIAWAHTDNARCSFMMFSETTEDHTNMVTNDRDFAEFFILWSTANTRWQLYLRTFDEGVSTADMETEDDSLDLDKWYYVKYSKVGDNVTSWFYNDALMTDLDFMLTIVDADVTDLRYFHPLNSQDQAIGGRAMDLHLNRVQNITTVSGYVDTGHFYTTDLLAGIDYMGQAVLLNTTIPGGDTLTIEFSEDNSTWILNDWEPIFGGYEAIDIRELGYSTLYSRVNFTDGGADSTPRLYQMKIYHGAPCPSVAEADYTPYIALSIILLLFGLMIGQRLKR